MDARWREGGRISETAGNANVWVGLQTPMIEIISGRPILDMRSSNGELTMCFSQMAMYISAGCFVSNILSRDPWAKNWSLGCHCSRPSHLQNKSPGNEVDTQRSTVYQLSRHYVI